MKTYTITEVLLILEMVSQRNLLRLAIQKNPEKFGAVKESRKVKKFGTEKDEVVWVISETHLPVVRAFLTEKIQNQRDREEKRRMSRHTLMRNYRRGSRHREE